MNNVRSRRKPPASDHFDGRTFFNPWLPPGALPKISDVFRMVREPRGEWPRWVENTATPELPGHVRRDEIALTFVNHATFLIQVHGLNILTDPVWSERVSPIGWAGPRRVRAPGIRFEDLPHIDLVMISHNHYDHLDVETLTRLNARCAPRVLVAVGNEPLLRSIGCADVAELDWWESIDVSDDCRVTFAPAQHQANRGVLDRQTTLWGSFMMHTGSRRLFFGGDTGYAPHFSQIRERLGRPDIALLGIGAYEPRWFMRPIHMSPADAVVAHRDLGSVHSVAMHFGTFRLSAEAFDQPPRDLKQAMDAAGLPDEAFVTMREGETRFLAGCRDLVRSALDVVPRGHSRGDEPGTCA